MDPPSQSILRSPCHSMSPTKQPADGNNVPLSTCSGLQSVTKSTALLGRPFFHESFNPSPQISVPLNPSHFTIIQFHVNRDIKAKFCHPYSSWQVPYSRSSPAEISGTRGRVNYSSLCIKGSRIWPMNLSDSIQTMQNKDAKLFLNRHRQAGSEILKASPHF